MKTDHEPSPADIPQRTYTSAEIWNPERIRALAIYCSDGRWGEAFDEFCHRHLNLPRYDRLALPGGPASLVRPELSDDQPVHRRQIEFLIRVHELERIILITHFGCAFYTERLGTRAEAAVAEQIADARRAASTVRKWFQDVSVDAYLAMRRDLTLSFHRL